MKLPTTKLPTTGALARGLGRFVLAVLAATLVGVAVSTQTVVAHLHAMDVPIDLGQRLSMTGQDLIGMGPAYAGLSTAALAIAFLFANLFVMMMPGLRRIVFAIAGFVAIVTLHEVMRTQLGVTGVAGARGTVGLGLMAVGGAWGGWIFGKAHRPAAAA